jgi:alkylation response protein AidB-like acyl-CoA dehydrogenase
MAASAEELVRQRLDGLLADHHPSREAPQDFRGAQYDAGLAWVWFPEGQGGLGVVPDLQDVVDDAVRGAGAAPDDETTGIGLGMAAPTIVAHGSEAHKARHLRSIFTGEEVWCQLFSEPGAGSDLAGLATRAVRDGDEWVIDGQKVWTSFAHFADWALCLARTDPNVPKHKGLTYFIVDMHSPGIEVRPLREMTGDAQFSEVFLSGVRVPDDQRVGGVGDGWRASLSTLASERAGMGQEPLGTAAMRECLDLWRRRPVDNAVTRDRLVSLWVCSEVYRLLNLRAAQQRVSGQPGPEGSAAKLAVAELSQRVYEFALEVMGPEGTLFPDGYGPRRLARGEQLLAGRDLHWLFLRSRGFTIEGGSAQIQRNVLAERVLGLPGDVRADRDVPWSEVPRN